MTNIEMTLLEKQKQYEFTRMVSNLITFATDEGYELIFNYSTSNTCSFNLYKDAQLTETNDYEKIGEFWESMGGAWGGRYQNHKFFQYK